MTQKAVWSNWRSLAVPILSGVLLLAIGHSGTIASGHIPQGSFCIGGHSPDSWGSRHRLGAICRGADRITIPEQLRTQLAEHIDEKASDPSFATKKALAFSNQVKHAEEHANRAQCKSPAAAFPDGERRCCSFSGIRM